MDTSQLAEIIQDLLQAPPASHPSSLELDGSFDLDMSTSTDLNSISTRDVDIDESDDVSPSLRRSASAYSAFPPFRLPAFCW